MTAEDIEMLQEKILQLCHAAGKFGMPDARILRALQKATYQIDEAALDRQLRYLKSKGWIAELERIAPRSAALGIHCGRRRNIS